MSVTLTVAGEPIEVEATNRACLLYASEFRGTEGSSGSLIKDLFTESDDLVALGAYSWADAPALMRVVWAMARAAGSTKEKWSAFEKRVMDAPCDFSEPVTAMAECMNGELGRTAFFRIAAGQDDTGQPDDETQE